jgi:hypothetical protein
LNTGAPAAVFPRAREKHAKTPQFHLIFGLQTRAFSAQKPTKSRAGVGLEPDENLPTTSIAANVRF